MGFWDKLRGKGPERPAMPAPGSLEAAAQVVQKEPPGPDELGRSEVKPGEEQRICTYWRRTVVLVDSPIAPSKHLTCEWTIKDNEAKRLCYQACTHNLVNQLAIDVVAQEKKLSEEQMLAIAAALGVKDHAPKPKS